MIILSTYTSCSISKILCIKHLSKNYFFCRMTKIESLDLEMGIYKEDLRAQNWMAKFKETGLIKWVMIQGTLIPKKCVHFPLIFIFCLLFSDVYPDILTITTSLIISLIISLALCSILFLHL